ncbi:MAG: hypothetical protein LBB61_02930 [Treponema sp.]|nr:hypothetical protein [Treponema sp.]
MKKFSNAEATVDKSLTLSAAQKMGSYISACNGKTAVVLQPYPLAFFFTFCYHTSFYTIV